MQTLVQVICSEGESLREAIVNDGRLHEHGLRVRTRRRTTREHGWADVCSTDPDRRGAIKIEWVRNASVLLCRIVNRTDGQPDLILGDLVAYLFRRHRKRIWMINVVPDR